MSFKDLYPLTTNESIGKPLFGLLVYVNKTPSELVLHEGGISIVKNLDNSVELINFEQIDVFYADYFIKKVETIAWIFSSTQEQDVYFINLEYRKGNMPVKCCIYLRKHECIIYNANILNNFIERYYAQKDVFENLVELPKIKSKQEALAFAKKLNAPDKRYLLEIKTLRVTGVCLGLFFLVAPFIGLRDVDWLFFAGLLIYFVAVKDVFSGYIFLMILFLIGLFTTVV